MYTTRATRSWPLRNAAPLNALADTAADTQLVLASSILNAVSGYNLDEGLSKLANFLTFFFYPSLCVMLFTTFVQRRFVGGADANVTSTFSRRTSRSRTTARRTPCFRSTPSS